MARFRQKDRTESRKWVPQRLIWPIQADELSGWLSVVVSFGSRCHMLSTRHPTVTQSSMSEADTPTPARDIARTVHGLDRSPATQDKKKPEDSVAAAQHDVPESPSH